MADSTNGGGPIETRGPVVFAVTTAMMVITTIFVGLRLFSRFYVVRRISWDDYFIILAWFLAFGISFSICYGTSVGLGRHEVDVPEDWQPALRRAEYAFSVLYNPALMSTKTSILAFYLNLSATQRYFKFATIATLIVVNAAGFALTILNVVQCQPIDAAFYSPPPDTAKCSDIITLYLSSAPVNIITDLAILVLPMPILTSMRLPKKQKTILIITFSFGAFVAVVDVIRIAYLQSAASRRLEEVVQVSRSTGGVSTAGRNNETSDFSWYASLSFMWSAIEVCVGNACACVPALKPLFARFLPQFIKDATDLEKTLADASNGNSIGKVPSGEKGGPGGGARPIDSSGHSPPKAPPPTMVSVNSNRTGGGGAGADAGGVGEMDLMDFLTTPDMGEFPEPQGSDRLRPTATNQTSQSNFSARTRQASVTFFDFVDVQQRKSMVHLTSRESVYPIAMVTVLFFIWGFAYGLLNVLNAQFQTLARMSSGQSTGIHSAYFFGYFVGPMTFGRIVFKRLGFKACYIVGLIIYACGTLVFWPSAVLTSFPAFLVSNFIVGLGLSTLEISANPFIALCGPPEYAEIRLNLSQGIQAVGSIVSPLLARKALFRDSSSNLIDVQWTYLGISLFTFFLALAYHYLPLPEATDDELEEAAERADRLHTATLPLSLPDLNFSSSSSLGSRRNPRLFHATLAAGVFSMFCYVGGQEAAATSFETYIAAARPGLDAVGHQAIAHTAFAASRFLAALVNLVVKPRYILTSTYAAALAFAAATAATGGTPGAALIVLFFFAEGPTFSLLFATSLRGAGRRTKDAATLLTAAVSGGAVFPALAYVARIARADPRAAFAVVAAVFAAGLAAVTLCWDAYPPARALLDPLPGDGNRRFDTRRPSEAGNKKNRRSGGVRRIRGRDLDSAASPATPGDEKAPNGGGLRSAAGPTALTLDDSDDYDPGAPQTPQPAFAPINYGRAHGSGKRPSPTASDASSSPPSSSSSSIGGGGGRHPPQRADKGARVLGRGAADGDGDGDAAVEHRERRPWPGGTPPTTPPPAPAVATATTAAPSSPRSPRRPGWAGGARPQSTLEKLAFEDDDSDEDEDEGGEGADSGGGGAAVGGAAPSPR